MKPLKYVENLSNELNLSFKARVGIRINDSLKIVLYYTEVSPYSP